MTFATSMRPRSSNCNALCSSASGSRDSPTTRRRWQGWKTRSAACSVPADYATYETLKESDLELFKLNEYADGISNVAPLSAADRESILKTKLAYKERFRQLLLDSGLQRTDLSLAEREYAYSVTSRALEGYKPSYLQEVRQYLTNEEQFALLSNYETTEFKAELARLRSMVDVQVQGGS